MLIVVHVTDVEQDKSVVNPQTGTYYPPTITVHFQDADTNQFMVTLPARMAPSYPVGRRVRLTVEPR